MSRKNELLKLAMVFHLEAGRTRTPASNEGCTEWANITKKKPIMRQISTLNGNGGPRSSIALAEGWLRKP